MRERTAAPQAGGEKSSFSSGNGAASRRPAKLPCSEIARDQLRLLGQTVLWGRPRRPCADRPAGRSPPSARAP